MTDIAANIISLKQQLPPSVKLVAVSKTKPASAIILAYNTGQRCFGENRAAELLRKRELLPGDIEWHMIGHLQTNKVKLIIPFISMIESADTFRLIQTVDTEASKTGRCVDCLLQIHIAQEETKFGFSLEEIFEMLQSDEFRKLKSVRICGVMGMATFTDDKNRIRNEFRYLADCFRMIKQEYFNNEESFREISMGMSGDYEIAIREGSTMVRIGSLIFGSREY